MAKIHCHSLLSGSSWSAFGQETLVEEEEAMEVDENNADGSEEATRLRQEEMLLYGLCPAHEDVTLVVCNECGRVVKTVAFQRHCEIHHNREVQVPTPSPATTVESPLVDTAVFQGSKAGNEDSSAIKIEHVELEDANVKIEEVPLTVPHFNHVLSTPVIPTKGLASPALKKMHSEKSIKKSARKCIPTREREFDAEKHCGVWVAEQNKRCTRSLTCKTHALSLRRAVPGRSMSFDKLLAEHKARVNCEKEQNNLLKAQENINNCKVVKADIGTTHPTSIKSQAQPSVHTTESTVTETAQKATGDAESDGVDDSTLRGDLSALNHHPRPMASCVFGARKTGRGFFAFNRKSDHLRCAMLAMVERCLNPCMQRQGPSKQGPLILHRPTVRTIAQASNQGLSSVADKSKPFAGSSRNLNNFLKAPPPPRNKSLKHGSQSHNLLPTLDHSSDKPNVYSSTLNTSHNKRIQVEVNATSSVNDEGSIGQHSSGFLRPDASSQAINDMGNIVASIDVNVANGQPLNQNHTFHSNNSLKTQGSNLNINPNASLDSSLNSSSPLGVTSQSSLPSTRTAFVTSNSFTSSLNSSTVNSGVVGSTNNNGPAVKDILPAHVHRKIPVTHVTSQTSNNASLYKSSKLTGQFESISGKTPTGSTVQRGSPIIFNKQVSSPLSNGTGPSPPPCQTVANTKGYPLSFVIQGNNGTKSAVGVTASSPVSMANFTKGQSLVFNNMGVAQLQSQQVSASVQQQRGKAGTRVSTFHKGVQPKQPSNNLQVKIPQSPSLQQSSPGQSSPQQTQQQQRTVLPNSPQQGQQTLYLNHQHIPTSQQPIAQLKQQVEQQQQQLQQITLQQQLQQQQQQLQQQQFQTQQKHQQINTQFLKQQLPIQPRIAPAPPQPSQTFISQQTLQGQNILVKSSDQQLNSPPSSVFGKSEGRRDLQQAVLQKPQSNVA